MIPLILKKQINILSILDFEIRGFFGLGEFCNLHSIDWRLALGSY
jgi:hypothetical protein